MSEERVKTFMNMVGAEEISNEGWRLAIEDIVIDANLRKERRILTLECDLPAPPETRRNDVCTLSLLYNQTWDSTEGARIDWFGKTFRLRQDISFELADDDALARNVDAFSAKCEGWSLLFEQMSPVAPESGQMLEALSAPGFIKT